ELSAIESNESTVELHASSPGEFPGLEAFLAEHGASLRRPERHRRFLATGRARGHGFDPLAGRSSAGRPGGALAFTGFASLRLVLEVLVGEKLLFARRPDELRAAIHAPEDPVLELHRSLPRRGRTLSLAPAGAIPARAATSSDSVSVQAPVWPGACLRVSDRRSAS